MQVYSCYSADTAESISARRDLNTVATVEEDDGGCQSH